MEKTNTRFESIGVYLPEKVVTTQELIDRMEYKPQFDLVDLTGVKERRWRAENEDSQTLAIKAAQRCLGNSQYEAKDLDVIISCSITRFKNTFFQMEPAFSKAIKNTLGLRATAVNFDIANACAGMMTGAYVLNSMIKSGAAKTGMVVSGECITPITETAVKEICEIIDPQFASLTVGDSGAACILDKAANGNEGIETFELFCMPEFSELCFGMPSEYNNGVAMYTDAISIHKQVIDRMPTMMPYYLEKLGMCADDFDFVIPHQTSSRAIKTAMDLCIPLFRKGPSDYFPEVLVSLDRYGNTSSTSHFVVLHDYLERGKIKPGAHIFFIVMASGIILGIVPVTLGNLEVNKWAQP
ncbi:MAG: 3-oxoacyl-[acyl-carrier-protein] synthase III C-terminal domain-containing protein [Desulfobacteraceae bacterium]|jgi:3-oxoacyl-[acyl-carrier-protein] synthase-3